MSVLGGGTHGWIFLSTVECWESAAPTPASDMSISMTNCCLWSGRLSIGTLQNCCLRTWNACSAPGVHWKLTPEEEDIPCSQRALDVTLHSICLLSREGIKAPFGRWKPWEEVNGTVVGTMWWQASSFLLCKRLPWDPNMQKGQQGDLGTQRQTLCASIGEAEPADKQIDWLKSLHPIINPED